MFYFLNGANDKTSCWLLFHIGINIATISDGTNTIQYYYDALNQLVRENNPFLGTSGKTVIYTYNRGGNIENKKEYALRSGTATPTTLLDTINYSYCSAFWKDKLTSYDGQSINHDSIGNVISYNGWNYAWKWGKRLATASNTAEGISTTYKYNDNGIRTYKQVTTASGHVQLQLDGRQYYL